MVVSGRIFCRRLAEIEVNVRWSVVCSDHRLSSRFPVFSRSKPKFLTAGSSQKSLRQTQVREWKAYQHYICGTASLKHFDILVPGESFSVNVASVVLIFILTFRCHLMFLRREEIIFLFRSVFNPSAYASQHDFEAGPWDEKAEESSCGVAGSKLCMEKPTAFHGPRRKNFDDFWFEVCLDTRRGRTNVAKAACGEAMWRKGRNNSPPLEPRVA